MLQIAICDDEQDTVQENKKTAEECLCQCKTAGKILIEQNRCAMA